MVTLKFDPGPCKLLIVKAIKDTLHIGLKEAKDIMELQKVQCEPERGDILAKAIEEVGGKVIS